MEKKPKRFQETLLKRMNQEHCTKIHIQIGSNFEMTWSQ
jgi:hypothetical protein